MLGVILLLVLFVGRSIAQTSAYSQSFGSGTVTTFPVGWTSQTPDWVIDPDVANGGAGIDGPNGGAKLAGADGSSSLERVVSNPFSTSNFSAMTISWNGYRSSVGAPTLILEMATSPTGPWTNIPFTDVFSDDAWHATPSSISIPATFEGQSSVYISFSYTGNSNNGYIMIDDISVTGTTPPDYFWDGVGALNSLTSWWTNSNATGANPSSFTANDQTFNLYPNNTNATSATLSGAWAIGGTNTDLNVGDGITGFNLTLNGGLTITSAKLIVNNNSTLTLQNATFPALSDVTINSNTTIDFAQSTLVSLWTTTYNNLTISGSADKSQSGSLTINGILNLNGSSLLMGSGGGFQNLTLNGTLTGSGNIKTGNSRLTIGGTGAFGTVTFAAGSTALTISGLTVNRTSSGSVILGSNLKVSGSSIFTNGKFDLNSKSLILNGATTFGSATFVGSLTSSLTIGGSGSITGSMFMDQTSASTKALADLTLNRAGTLTLGSALEIWGAVTPSVGTITTGGNLTVKQDATNKGRIGTISSGGFSGNVTVETFILGGNTGWALLGASGISGQTMNDWYGQFPMAIEGSATGVTSAGGYFESVQGWNESDSYGYDTTITVSTPLGAGKGYWTYLGTGPSTTSDITLVLTGTPITGNVTIPLTNSAQSGTCLIANPYASPISWTALRNGNTNVANATYIYNADGAYASFVGGIGANGGSDIIPAGQGFFVEAGSATNLTAQESNKVSSNIDLMKTSSSSVNVGLPIRLKLNGFSADYDETVVRFHGLATSAYDLEWDARKIFQTPGYVGYPGGYSKYTTISTKGGSLDYSINSLPFALTQNAVVPVLVKVMSSGQYTITGQDMQLLPQNACVTLKDKLLNVTHNIKATPYVFTMNDTTSTARFELTVCADITAGINDNNSSESTIDQSVLISQSVSGVNVNLNFDKTTKAKISVTNVLGQKIVENKIVNTQNESVFFGLEAKNQLLFITVETENNKVTKKVIH